MVLVAHVAWRLSCWGATCYVWAQSFVEHILDFLLTLHSHCSSAYNLGEEYGEKDGVGDDTMFRQEVDAEEGMP